MKKFTAFALAILMVLTLCACAKSGEDASMFGTYKLYAMEYDPNTVVLTDELFEGENYITIQKGGTAEMCLEDDVAAVTWKADGEKLRFTAADGEMEGSLSDGILTLIADGTKLFFIGENAATEKLHAVSLDEALGGAAGLLGDDPDEDLTDEPDAEETEVQKMWNGWYYGCIDLSGCEGGWEYVNGMTFDAAMQIELDEEGYGKLIIFDPYGAFAVNPEHQNRYVVIDCHADTLYLYGDSGTAFDYDINTSDWRVVHNLDNPDKLNVGSSYTDASGNKLGYDFTFLPWGDRWEKETYQQFIPNFDEYLAMLDAGKTSLFDDGTGSSAENPSVSGGDNGGASSGLSDLLGSNPTRLDVNDRGIVNIYYPADQFRYDDDYGKLKNDDTGVGILIDPMLGASNFDELKASYEANNSDEDDYSLTETTICGYKALIMTYSDWLGATMRVDIDFGGNHDGWYGISFAVSGDSLADCDTDLIWAISESMELLK